MRLIFIAVLLMVGLVLADRLLRSADERGWIHYRRGPDSAAGASVLGELLSMFRPGSGPVDQEPDREHDRSTRPDPGLLGPRPDDIRGEIEP